MDINRSNKRKWFNLKKKQEAKNIQLKLFVIDTVYADDLMLLTNTPSQAESQLHFLKQAVRGIGFCVNANKTEFLCSKQEGAISTLNDKPLELSDKFIYLGSNISSESDVNIYLVNVWTIMDKLPILWKS